MIWQFIAVYAISFVWNYLVQLGYYVWEKRKNPHAFSGQRTLLQYYTGYLGDGVIVPIINILIYYIIVRLGEGLEGIGGLEGLGIMLALALVVDFGIHYLQGNLKLTNWSMPKPFVWNFAGHWHMVSFPIQISYLLIFFYIVFTRWNTILTQQSLIASVIGVFALMLFFLYLFVKDTRL